MVVQREIAAADTPRVRGSGHLSDSTVGRRRLLKAAGGGAAVWSAAAVGGRPAWNVLRSREAWAQAGPDVYVVTLDDCSPEYIGYYQSLLPTAYPGPVFTPELDAILSASWTATSARATVPVCAASRSSFLTGADAKAIGIFGLEGLNVTPALTQFHQKVSSGQLVSLPGFLTAQGLKTATRGKVAHVGGLWNISGQIVQKGVHTNVQALFEDPDYAPDGWLGDGSGMPFATLPAGRVHVDHMRVDEQIARVQSTVTGQRVDFLGFVMPHTPRTVHQQWIDLYDPADIVLRTTPAEVAADIADIPDTHLGFLEEPYFGAMPRAEWMDANLTEGGLKEHVRHMLATVSHTSFQIGRLKTALDAAGRPYVMVLTADHGYHLAEKGHWAKGGLYDKSLRVPLAIYSSAPNANYPVGNTNKPVSLLGLARTVAQLAEIPAAAVPGQWQGHRFDDPSAYCTEHTWGLDGPGSSRALVFRDTVNIIDYKLIVHPGDSAELYNLTADPGEIDNLFVPNPPPGVAQQLDAVDQELKQRARRRRAAEWVARGGRRSDPAYR